MKIAAAKNTAARMLESLEPRCLLAADPITPDNPFWAVPRGHAVVDGVLGSEWDHALEIFRTQATRDDRAVWIRMMWADGGLYVSAEVQDDNLWADGTGGGAGNRWEVETDDSLTLYFDPDNSRDEWMQASDFAFGASIAPWSAAYNGSGAVKRYKYVKGDGAGGAADAQSFNWYDAEQAGLNPLDQFLPPGASYATHLDGTVNNSSDTDNGWTMEMYIPWNSLGVASPKNGTTLGMNFDLIQDNDGGTRNLTDNRDASNRFSVPHFIDDHVQGVHSSYTATLAGVHGPVNYAQVMLIDAAAQDRPAPIASLAPTDVTAFGAALTFEAPSGTQDGQGSATAYQVRYSTSPITNETGWAKATEFSNSYVPRLAGLTERIRLTGLTPQTTYYVAIRAVDGAGHLADLGAGASFTTAAAAPGAKGRIVVSPNGNTFQFENGEPFIAVGDHLGLPWGYTRNLYPGDVWDPAQQKFLNFSTQPSYEGTAGPYFNTLAAYGVNTMRVYLELQNLPMTGNTQYPRGAYWLEYPAGHYNPAMKQFVLNLLQQAGTHGIYLILSPFDSFSYDEAFATENSFAKVNGGSLDSIDDFYQTPATLDQAKARMDAVISWVNESPYKDHVLGWEPLSEWDSFEWTLNAEGDGSPGRETEMRRRAQWIDALAAHIKQQDPAHLVLNSTIVRDPRGPLAREIFYSRTFDALSPHLYTNSNEEPINNPQTDRKVMPAVENGYFTSYWLSHRIDGRPVLNGEWGMTRSDWQSAGWGLPSYRTQFTALEDNSIYRTMLWSGLASGQAGTGLRISTEELSYNYYTLPSSMRMTQFTLDKFVDSTSLKLDFTTLHGRNLAGRIKASSVSGRALLSWGTSDGTQGIAYVLQDGNRTTGAVADGQLVIRGLARDQIIDVEVWSTTGGVSGPALSTSGVYVGDGTLTISLPTFNEDVAVKFKARARSVQTQQIVAVDAFGTPVTFTLDAAGQPIARVLDAANRTYSTQEIGAVSGFRGRIVDLTPFTTPDGQTHLAATDTEHHVWLFSGSVAAGTWSARDLTSEIDAPGLSGDLTTYQPSWGSIHIAGLDARGHAVNYWWAPGLDNWQYSDLTSLISGPTLSRGLTGYVASWDGLNLAGLNDSGQVVVYWWAPGLSAWQTINMTTAFEGPTFTGQLDAYVTPWGGLNIAGVTGAGKVVTYWWAPGLPDDPNRWRVSDITTAANGPALAEGTGVVVSRDGGINILGVDAQGQLHALRWTPSSPTWAATNASQDAAGSTVQLPLAGAAGDNAFAVFARSRQQPDKTSLYWFDTLAETWELFSSSPAI